ncbi:FAST kinase domain-containing protein 5, mitochondrial-like [Diadema setosum]|uniref:FAST kinase domain-containing protein 5, mitochondrial-like n=1 Tax=Diadema setosum TaxID=31175 RepID=UPI003B3BB5C1
MKQNCLEKYTAVGCLSLPFKANLTFMRQPLQFYNSRNSFYSGVSCARDFSSRSRNNMVREKTKTLRFSALEVIYGGKDKIPDEIEWDRSERQRDTLREDLSETEDDFENIEDGTAVSNSARASKVKQRAFLKESEDYQRASVACISIDQEQSTLADDRHLDHFLRKLESGEELCHEDIINGLHRLLRLPAEKRQERIQLAAVNNLADVLCSSMAAMTTKEFVTSLLVFHWYDIPLTPHQNTIVEKECLRRMPSWDINTLFLVTDWWICKSGVTSWAFHDKMVARVRASWTRLSPRHTVQAFYLCGQFKSPNQDVMEKLLHLAERIVDNLSLTEVATICNGIIKMSGRLPPRSILPAVIASSLSLNLQLETDLDQYNVVTIMRFLGRSYYYEKNLFYKLAKKLEPCIANLDQLALPHIAAVFARARLLPESLFAEILRCFNHSRASLKDYFLTIWAFCRLNFHSMQFENFLDEVITRIEKEEAWTREAAFMFVKTLVPLSFIGQYPQKLLDRAFSPAYLLNYKGHAPYDVYKHLSCLDSSLSLECPEYRGHRLPKTDAEYARFVPHGSTKVIWNKNQEYGEIIQLLTELLRGHQYLLVHPILDHIRTPVDIEIRLDREGRPVDMLSSAASGEFERRLAVLVGRPTHYKRDTRELLGAHVMKRRQLKISGYEIVELPFYEWYPMRKKSRADKISYLSRKIFNR